MTRSVNDRMGGFAIFLTLLLTPYPLLYGAGTTAGETLTQPVGARASGMGEAFTAVADDVSAIFWNPAGLSRLHRGEMSLMYLRGLGDGNFGFAGGALPVRSVGTLGMAVTTLQGGPLEMNHPDGSARTVQSQEDYVVTLSFARTLGRIPHPVRFQETLLKFGAGVAGKYRRFSLAETATSRGVAADAGLHLSLWRERLNFGFALSNLGPGVRFRSVSDALPKTFRAGTAIRFSAQGNPMILSFDWVQRLEESRASFHFGAEWVYKNILALRAGARVLKNSEQLITFGLGYKKGNFRFDWASSLLSRLQDAQRISIGYQFGSEKEKREPRYRRRRSE